jgi:polysaccharide export outer membrane protein
LQHKVLFNVKDQKIIEKMLAKINFVAKFGSMRRALLLIIVCGSLASCKVFNPSAMLRTPANFDYATQADSIRDEYRIAPDDVISFIVMPNQGERLVTGITEQSMQGNQMTEKTGLSYVVESDGNVRLPILGMVKCAGLTRREAESQLESRYAAYINDPYVKITVDNRRVFVFRGDNSAVIKLENQNTTLFEVLAQAGGTTDSKAHKIKLIRKGSQGPQVYQIDLSRVENLNQGNMVLQSNDVIYITPRDRVPERVIALITPYLSILATAFAVIALFK